MKRCANLVLLASMQHSFSNLKFTAALVLQCVNEYYSKMKRKSPAYGVLKFTTIFSACKIIPFSAL